MQDSFRRSTLTLPIPAAIAVGVGQVTFSVRHKGRIAGAHLCLSDTGTGAGATSVQVNVNGAAILAAPGLSIAGAAASKTIEVDVTIGSQYPGGSRINKGDQITLDVIAVPATTVPKGGFVVLDIVQVDA